MLNSLVLAAAFLVAGIILWPDDDPVPKPVDLVKVAEVPPAPKRESHLLTHPLTCDGIWTQTSADFGPSKDYCNSEEVKR